MNTEEHKTQIATDIEFAQESLDEFAIGANSGQRQGSGIAPMLRYVAGLNEHAACADFVHVAVEYGYNPSTAKTCFYVGRKWMRDNS